MNQSVIEFRQFLFEQQDLSYQTFSRKLIPSVDPAAVIGVRMPQLRQIARSAAGSAKTMQFMADLPHTYLEENNLHALLIEPVTDFAAAMDQVNSFLPFIDNWATCDLLAPKAFDQNLPALYQQIENWLESERTYTIRFAIGMLMRHYLGEAFRPEFLERVAGVRSDDYYVNMMIAWYFATALAKQYNAALPILEGRHLDQWTHNKTIQKATESRRIDAQTKAYLRTLKVSR